MDCKKAATRIISGVLAVMMAGSQFTMVAYAAEAYAQAPAVQTEAQAEPQTEAAAVAEAGTSAEAAVEAPTAPEAAQEVAAPASPEIPDVAPAAEPAQAAEAELAAAAETPDVTPDVTPDAAPETAAAETVAEELPEFMEGEQLPLVQEEDGSFTYTEDTTLVQNDAAAAAVEGSDNTEYLGDVDGTNLSLYKVNTDADAIEVDPSLDADESAMYKAWFAADAPHRR